MGGDLLQGSVRKEYKTFFRMTDAYDLVRLMISLPGSICSRKRIEFLIGIKIIQGQCAVEVNGAG